MVSGLSKYVSGACAAGWTFAEAHCVFMMQESCVPEHLDLLCTKPFVPVTGPQQPIAPMRLGDYQVQLASWEQPFRKLA